MEDRSSLFNEIQKFSQRKLKKVETNVVTATGDKVVEKRSAKGLQTSNDNKAIKAEGDAPKDLQVGLIVPGLMIGSQDVAHSQKTIEEYEITHILNLAGSMVDNHFENEYNYLTLNINDKLDEDLKKHFDDVFEFIDEGRQRGNCFVHCDATKPGLSRSTAFCVAYLMKNEEKRYQDAYNEVKEARAFVRPNDGFVEQLKKYDEELFGEGKKEEIEDPFTKKKRQEIEAEKEMLKGTTSVKNKLAMFKTQEDEEKKVASPTPNKIKTDWISSETNSSEDKNGEGQGKPPPPKKLTSILSIFQQPKEGRDLSNSPQSSKIIAGNTGPVKKWKPVETKGLQRAKDPQVKVNEHKDYSQYEKVKRSKSGTKWGKKDGVKKTKSREFKEASKKSNDENKVSETTDKANASSLSPKEQSKSALSTSPPKSKLLNKKEAPTPPSPPSDPLIETNGKVTSSPEIVKKPSSESRIDQIKPKVRRRGSKDVENDKKVQPPAPVSAKVCSAPAPAPAPPPPPPPPPSSLLKDDDKASNKENSKSIEKANLKRSTKDHEENEKKKESSQLSRSKKTKESTPIKEDKSNNVNNFKSQIRSTSSTDAEVSNKSRDTVSQKVGSTSTTSNNDSKTESNESQTEDNRRMVFNVSRPKPKNIRGGAIINADEVLNKSNNSNKTETKKVTSKAPTIETVPVKSKSNLEQSKVEEPIVEQKSEVVKPKVTPKSNLNKKSDQNKDVKESKAISKDDKSKVKSKSSQAEDSDKPLDYHYNRKGLTRSSTAEILKLIKSKTKSDLPTPMSVIDEDDEIDVLLEGLENEGIENIDWGELGIGLSEVQDIVENAEDESEEEQDEETEESDESGSDEDEDENEDEEGEDEDAEGEDEEEKEIRGLLKNLEKEGMDKKTNNAILNDQNDKSKPKANINQSTKPVAKESPKQPPSLNKPTTQPPPKEAPIQPPSKSQLSSIFSTEDSSEDEFEIELEEASD